MLFYYNPGFVRGMEYLEKVWKSIDFREFCADFFGRCLPFEFGGN